MRFGPVENAFADAIDNFVEDALPDCSHEWRDSVAYDIYMETVNAFHAAVARQEIS